jgi:hypothetical protein
VHLRCDIAVAPVAQTRSVERALEVGAVGALLSCHVLSQGRARQPHCAATPRAAYMRSAVLQGGAAARAVRAARFA